MPRNKNSLSPATPKTIASKNDCAELMKTVELQQEEIRRLREFVDAQSSHIVQIEENFVALKNRVAANEATIERNQSIAYLKDHIITELQKQLNKTRQFMRRPCISIVGLAKPR